LPRDRRINSFEIQTYRGEWCKAQDCGLVTQDLIFLIDANVEAISSGDNYSEERYEKVDFQRKVTSGYGKF
jgi:dTMP kinase